MSGKPMSLRMETLLASAHRETGKLIFIGNRMLAGVVTLGSIFCMLTMLSFQLAMKPEQVFHMQAFIFNYADFAYAATDTPPTTGKRVHLKASVVKDPNWDGFLAGAGLGLTLGRNIPLVGCVVGPVAGALIGYRMDSRI